MASHGGDWGQARRWTGCSRPQWNGSEISDATAFHNHGRFAAVVMTLGTTRFG
jgi:hypothetical protein